MARKGYRRKRTKIAKLSKPMSTAVKRIVQSKIETKQVDVQYGSTTAMAQANSTGTVVFLSGIAQGTTSLTRVGVKIQPTALSMKLLLRFYNSVPTSMVYTNNPVRVVVFSYDSSIYAGTSPANPTILDLLPEFGVTTDRIFRPWSVPNRGIYKIHYDKLFNPSLSAQAYLPVQINLSKKRLPGYIHYTGTGNTVASSGMNGLFLMVISAYDPIVMGAGGANTHVEWCLGASRLSYKDA